MNEEIPTAETSQEPTDQLFALGMPHTTSPADLDELRGLVEKLGGSLTPVTDADRAAYDTPTLAAYAVHTAMTDAAEDEESQDDPELTRYPAAFVKLQGAVADFYERPQAPYLHEQPFTKEKIDEYVREGILSITYLVSQTVSARVVQRSDPVEGVVITAEIDEPEGFDRSGIRTTYTIRARGAERTSQLFHTERRRFGEDKIVYQDAHPAQALDAAHIERLTEDLQAIDVCQGGYWSQETGMITREPYASNRIIPNKY